MLLALAASAWMTLSDRRSSVPVQGGPAPSMILADPAPIPVIPVPEAFDHPIEGDQPLDGAVPKVTDGELRARRSLEDKVSSGRGSTADLRILMTICRHQRDAACVERTKTMLEK